jgi:hypothetical protein
MSNVNLATLSDAERIGEGISRGVRKLGPEVQQQLQALVTPQALAIAGGFFVAWLVSHAFGIGFIVDAILLGVGFTAVGLAVFSGIDELTEFGKGALAARTDADMDRAADHFAKAVAILGVQTLLALLLRRSPQTFRGGRPYTGPPPANAGIVLKPGLRGVRNSRPTWERGQGETSWWGEISISRLGTASDRRIVALHEAVHRALTPKLNILRQARVDWRAGSYSRSSFRRYLEEALAEGFAQVKVGNGLRGAWTGICFPVRRGYVKLFASTGARGSVEHGFVTEAVGMFLGTLNVNGWIWNAYFSEQRPE